MTDSSPRRRGRPQQISREQIVDAAVRLGAEGEPGDLRMSEVARALDVGPAALYNHVRDREELLALVAARIMEETEYDDFEPGPDATWQDWVVAFATAVRAAVLASTNPDDALRYGERAPYDAEVHEHALNLLDSRDPRRAIAAGRLAAALRD